MKKRAMIMGVTGGFGRHVARSLKQRGWELTLLVRDKSRVAEEFSSAEIIVGDASRAEDVRRAASGVELIVYGINVPYDKWQELALPLLETALSVAVEKQLRFVFPGNVYNFDPFEGPVFAEGASQNPRTTKGEIRRKMELKLREASAPGTPVLILRAGDFFGSDAPTTWFSEVVKGKRFVYPGSLDLPHSWAYLPDVGECIGELLEHPEQLGSFEEFHFPGYEITGSQLLEALNGLNNPGGYQIAKFPWWAVRLGGLFSGLLREVLEMRYLWERRVALREDRLSKVLGNVPYTPLEQALKATVT